MSPKTRAPGCLSLIDDDDGRASRCSGPQISMLATPDEEGAPAILMYICKSYQQLCATVCAYSVQYIYIELTAQVFLLSSSTFYVMSYHSSRVFTSLMPLDVIFCWMQQQYIHSSSSGQNVLCFDPEMQKFYTSCVHKYDGIIICSAELLESQRRVRRIVIVHIICFLPEEDRKDFLFLRCRAIIFFSRSCKAPHFYSSDFTLPAFWSSKISYIILTFFFLSSFIQKWRNHPKMISSRY